MNRKSLKPSENASSAEHFHNGIEDERRIETEHEGTLIYIIVHFIKSGFKLCPYHWKIPLKNDKNQYLLT